METIIETFAPYLYFMGILVGLLTPLLILLLPTFASSGAECLSIGFSENVSQADERIGKIFEIVLGLIYILINVALVGGLLYGIKLQVWRRDSEEL